MNDPKHEARTLRVTYSSGDVGRRFTIVVNDQVIAEVESQAGNKSAFYSVEYPLPHALVASAKDGKLVIKFIAHKNSIAGGIFDLRLLRHGK